MAQFTIVFDGDIKKWDGNPFDVETPFGKPHAIAAFNAIDQLDMIKEQLGEISQSDYPPFTNRE